MCGVSQTLEADTDIMLQPYYRNETLRLQPAVMTYAQRAPAEGGGGHWLGQRYVVGVAENVLIISSSGCLPHFYRFISEGTAVIAPIYTIHRDPANFSPFPDDFYPDRWLHKHSLSTTESESHDGGEDKFSDNTNLDGIAGLSFKWHTNTSAFMPFSTGPANCAGKNLALAEMRAVVAVLVQRFDVGFAEGYVAESYKEKLADRFITQVGELKVMLSLRK